MKTEPKALPDLSTRLALRPVEAADALGISERKLREILPTLPVIRMDGCILIPIEPLRERLRELTRVHGNDLLNTVNQVMSDLGENDE
jgi:hypothetical protein